MENLVGIIVKDKNFGEVGFVTWGRVFDRVDPEPLLEAIKLNLKIFGIKELESIEVCDTLQEVSGFPYFYEAIFKFARDIIPKNMLYENWCKKKRQAILEGEDIYFLGLTKEQKNRGKKTGGTISHGVYFKFK